MIAEPETLQCCFFSWRINLIIIFAFIYGKYFARLMFALDLWIIADQVSGAILVDTSEQ